MKKLIFVIACILCVGSSFSQELSKKERTFILKEIPKLLRENHIIPEVGSKTAKGIEENFKSGKYDKMDTYDKLISGVTRDLQDLSDDLHLYLRKPDRQGNPSRRGGSGDSYARFRDDNGKLYNHKKLEGNILYMSLRIFSDRGVMAEELREALKESTKSDAIIIDLRGCPGGSPQGVAYLGGSIIKDRTHISTHRTKGGSSGVYSDVTDYGKLNNNKPVYVLINRRTGSAAEAFAFFIRDLGRIKVIGVHSRGAGRATRHYPINSKLNISISSSVVTSSKGNQFQGIGVKPDIPTSEEDALKVAHIEVLKEIIEKNPKKKTKLTGLIQNLQKK